jgi:hypothetical protein
MKLKDIQQELTNEYGVWVITEVTEYDGSIWYDVRNYDTFNETVVYPSQIGTSWKLA